MRAMMFAIALGAAVPGGGAKAATVSFTGSSNGSDITLSPFDTSLGTLTGVEFAARASSDASDVEFAQYGHIATATASASISVAFLGEFEFDSAFQTFTCTSTFIPCNVIAIADASVFVRNFLDNQYFHLVSGPGPVIADFTFVGDVATANASIIYTYDVATVPLPATGGMLLAGLGALALRRRRAA
jgi:hypothetical protein